MLRNWEIFLFIKNKILTSRIKIEYSNFSLIISWHLFVVRDERYCRTHRNDIENKIRYNEIVKWIVRSRIIVSTPWFEIRWFELRNSTPHRGDCDSISTERDIRDTFTSDSVELENCFQTTRSFAKYSNSYITNIYMENLFTIIT